MNFDPRTPVVLYDSPLPGMRWLRPRWILMAAAVVVKNIFVSPCYRGLLSGRCLNWLAASRPDRQPVEAVKVSAVLVDVTPEPVDSPVPASLAGADGSTNRTPPLVRQAMLESGHFFTVILWSDHQPLHSRVVLMGSWILLETSPLVCRPRPTLIAGDVTAGVSSPTYLAEGVTIGVAPSAVAGVASSADLAEVASSADLAGYGAPLVPHYRVFGDCFSCGSLHQIDRLHRPVVLRTARWTTILRPGKLLRP